MKIPGNFICFVLLLAGFFTNSVLAQTALSSLDPENYFDFWLGKWEVSWEEANGTAGRGTNHIYTILNDKVLLENFEILEGNNKGFKGKSMSVYQPARECWKQAWADNNGGYYDFTGIFTDEKRIFQTEVNELPDGRRFVQRMVFYDISEDSFTWDWESSQDGGKNWSLNWRIFYERLE